ncbi:MAG: site-specific DNA-methyltransferase [Bacteroidetes bacterium]|jgi:adenine-specific DNA-methyltransferase|nr:site-specific DNA-methyltransferase [Bacteroidota bacterium]
MANNISALEQLKSFLNELFQFDSQDLDFGVYKILHYKRKEIKDFIDNLLVDKVQEQLQTLTSEESKKAIEQLRELEQDEFIQGWINANEEERKAAEKFGKQKIAEYKRIKTQVTEAKVSGETENHIYNHLTLFFSRYYDKGDFISKRRFGKNEKYMVPYNGEETHFYWANHDQYYIKSSETFHQYAFKITTPQDNMVVNFKLTSAQLEQGNVKADEPNFFILSEKEAEIGEKETNFFFEYRPLTDDEKKTFKGNNKQDVLDERAFEALNNKYGKEVNLVKLWETDKDDKALLLKKLNHYTRKNKYDFFIHKNLKGFLQRELDYYIKSELINVDDLYVTEVDSYFDRLKHNVKTIKVFKNIADTIIEFVSQIEDFQKKLWEKKKFVLSTEWVITIDRLVEYIGEKAAKPILEEVIKNEKQVAEWKELFGEEIFQDWQKIKLSDLAPLRETNFSQRREDAKEWLKLPIDTVHFSKKFKIWLLNGLSEKINLEDFLSGFALKSDNFHGIKNLNEKYNRKAKIIYIDPPYNSGYSEIIYKNTFKHSSWMTLMQNRIQVAKPMLKTEGLHITAIDENEQERLGMLLKSEFGDFENTCVTIIHNPSGQQGDNFSFTHEYAYFSYPSDGKHIGLELRPEDEADIRNFRDVTGEDSKREAAKNCFYPILIKNGEIVGFGDVCSENYHPEDVNITRKDGVIEIYPIDPNGIERKWRFARQTVESIQKELLPHFLKKRNVWDIKRTKRLFNFKTVWTDSKYFANNHGTQVLNHILGKEKFSFPKSVFTVEDCIKAGSNGEETPLIIDYFAGSGTTFHSVQLLNQKHFNGKVILIEQGEYFYSVIIPRIKKIAYSFDWKDGKPKNGSMKGLGVFFKYQRLEQYEEALENIAFTTNKDAQQQALEFDQYIPKYMLEFETKNSQTLVNAEAMKDPWDYKLKVWDGFTYDTEQAVDLVETFNYLIGLHMQKCITKELNGRKYQFVYGHNNANKNILAVWRSVKDWKLEDYSKDREVLSKELESYSFDILYINEQAHLPEKYTYQPIEEVFKNKMLP